MTTINPLPDPPSWGDPASFSTKADAWVAALTPWTTQVNTVAGEVATNAAAVATQAGQVATNTTTCTTQAGIATTKAGEAASSATAAGLAEVAAAAAQAAAEAAAATAVGFLGQSINLTASGMLLANKAYDFATAGQTYTLPATPADGDTVMLINTGTATDNVIARNGQTIQGLAEDMTFNKAGVTATLKFTGSDWRLV